jgi:hypothetical protein
MKRISVIANLERNPGFNTGANVKLGWITVTVYAFSLRMVATL